MSAHGARGVERAPPGSGQRHEANALAMWQRRESWRWPKGCRELGKAADACADRALLRVRDGNQGHHDANTT